MGDGLFWDKDWSIWLRLNLQDWKDELKMHLFEIGLIVVLVNRVLMKSGG